MISTTGLLDRLQAVIDEARKQTTAKKKYGTYVTSAAVGVHLLQEDGTFYYTSGRFGDVRPRKTVATFYCGDGVDAAKRARDLCDELNSKEAS